MRGPSRWAAAMASIVASWALTSAGTLPAGATPANATSTPGWRVVFSHVYPQPINPGGAYTVVIAPARHDAWAFGGSSVGGLGGYPVAAHWNGRHWQIAHLPAGLGGWIFAASASSATDIWAASYFSGYVLRYDGHSWSVAKRFNPFGEITGITAISATNVWVFGDSGAEPGNGTWHFDGHHWAKITGIGRAINAASVVTPRDIWAFGNINAPQDSVEHYNGTSWTHVTAPALAGLTMYAIFARSDRDVWVSAADFASTHVPVLVHWNGRAWSKLPIPGRAIAFQLIGDGAGGLWLTTTSFGGTAPATTTVLHRSSSGKWTQTKLTNHGIDGLALIPGTTSVWGSGGFIPDHAAIYAHGRVS
jgi:hypothetical protein